MAVYQVTNESTQHGVSTPHGVTVPHKYPVTSSDTDTLIELTKSLYPTGRVWQMPEFGNFELFHKALNVSFLRFIQDSELIFDSTYPDNPNFVNEDAALWEFRLGLQTNLSLSLEDRKQSILRKINFPGGVQARQSPLYIQTELQKAGFEVYIHENTAPFISPDDLVTTVLTGTEHSSSTEHGNSTEHGKYDTGSFKVIANSINPNEMYDFGVDENLAFTFYFSGPTIDQVAVIEQGREREFRELVLKLKPAHTVAFLIINFI